MADKINGGDAEDDIELEEEDEEPPAKKQATVSKEKFKIAHVNAEKKRREAIKEGYRNLTDAIATMSEDEKSKLTRSEILEIACDRVETLKHTIESKKQERDALEQKLKALRVISDAYETMPKTSEKTSIPSDLACVVSNHIKLKLLTTLISKQFESFCGVINTENLQSLASSLFYWVEVHWRPVDLKEYLIGLLRVLRNRFADKREPVQSISSH